MASYQARNELVLNRQLEVQKMSIPFVIVGNASSGSVAVSNDEPAVMFLKTSGVDQITPNLSVNETATYSSSPSDSSGVFNVLLKLQEPVVKVISLRFSDLVTGASGASTTLAYLGSSTGITTGTGGGQSIMVSCTGVAINTSNTINGVLEVEYIAAGDYTSGGSSL